MHGTGPRVFDEGSDGGFGIVHDGKRAVFTLHGEIDQRVAPRLRSAVEAACALGRTALTFECSGVAFMDSSGLNAIAFASSAADGHGGVVEVANAPPLLRRLLEITAIDTIVDLTVTPAPSGTTPDPDAIGTDLAVR